MDSNENCGAAPRNRQKNAVPHVESGATIIETDVVVKRRKSSGAGGVAVRVVQRVVAEERKLCAHSNAAVDDELLLPEDAFGLILVHVGGISEWMESG